MSYWFLEETEDGQFWCDLPTSHKGKVYKHELALNYLHKQIEMLPHATALQLQYIGKEKAKEEATEYQHEEANTV